ncbi:Metallo-dependent hydrolase [Dendrothele bispora CBS 962.96]|uniref:Metallo-dependent hydrolase n=1 Tax=Dendrothele bispora (strain CBS 962.96) TaxID=1314807 RepID=A0A4S8MQH3_DENBC|nr:Metallo-dependent hydrolase [Dendrothele bispora CBS 962.96]
MFFKQWCETNFWQQLNTSHDRGHDDHHRRRSGAALKLAVKNVRLPDCNDPKITWNVICEKGTVSAVTPYTDQVQPNSTTRSSGIQYDELDAQGSLLLPSLCHSHIHLDKCFILDKCGDLETGGFTEAMNLTGTAKSAFPLEKDSLMKRGRQLIRDSVQCGVTALRAHVEVDSLAEFSALNVALQLKEEFKQVCHVQIALFAQEALFRTPTDAQPNQNWDFIVQALERESSSIEAIGSAPYVEPSIDQAKKNIAMIFDLADQFSLHVDFHLDYNLNPNAEPLIYEVIAQARQPTRTWIEFNRHPSPSDEADWEKGPEEYREEVAPKLNRHCHRHHRRITIGHSTRLQLFTPTEWSKLVDAIGNLPITFVGLPHSDLYMQGRDSFDTPLGAPRGTLRVPQLTKKYGLEIAMGVNNVQNAFTPQGSVDPLSLCSLGVAVFQAATKRDIEILMRSVTLTSKLAIGLGPDQVNAQSQGQSLSPAPGSPADFVILHNTRTLRDAVLNPSYDRTTIYQGQIVAKRTSDKWVLSSLNTSQQQVHGPSHSPESVAVVMNYIKPWKWWWYVFFPITWPYNVVSNLIQRARAG